ncbi:MULTISPECIES: glycoside hydrolase family 99-like domain-containing protein [Pseudomonas syringae group]|uniref:Glycosyl transferase family 2 n=1 Tax=Pseudomonas syringae pv. actinidiae TaxID=103796 RepID=A0A7Z6UIT7_PSESF|nr:MULTISPECIES: glycoside hydrolase family 99-like domain-containing protein [Pseudomonas syringae group]MDU8459091.1 glycoside hydrolase family 99-like domain-containing protein [Pseudomonas syringae group sp. J254-4]RMR56931.1 Glycosyl transferase family 2 [Pseudomonas syringae pv. actinidiae]
MSGLFSNLLVSSPNGGGLFFINANSVKKLDSFNTVGLFAESGRFFRGIQPDSLWVYGDTALEIDSGTVPVGDVHDVLEFEDHIYVVGTTGNEVIKLDKQGVERQRWRFPGEDDSRHVNCLGIWNGTIVYSAFGEFTRHRGYKGLSDGQGFVNELFSGKRLVSGLSQPHTPVGHGDNLLLANSERSELHEYGPGGDLIRKKVLPGYTRGICVTGDAIYVGMSKSRNLDAGGLASAVLIALDTDTWEELGRIALPASEIYSVISISDDAELLWAVSEIASHTVSRLEHRVSDLLEQANEEHVNSLSRREFIDAISDQLRDWLNAFRQFSDDSHLGRDASLGAVIQAHALEQFFAAPTADNEGAAIADIKRMLDAVNAISQAQEASYREHIRHLEVLVTGYLESEQASREKLLELEEAIVVFKQNEHSDHERLQQLEQMVEDSETSGRASLEQLKQLEMMHEASEASGRASLERLKQLEMMHEASEASGRASLERLKQFEMMHEASEASGRASLERLKQFEVMIEASESTSRASLERLRQLETMISDSETTGRASVDRLLELEATLAALTVDGEAYRNGSEQEINTYRALLESIQNSRTWRWTKPVRRANADVSKMKRRIKNSLVNVYRDLPMASHNKQKLKGALFRYFGFVFKDLAAYKLWKEYQERSISWPVAESQETDLAELPPVTSQPNVELPNANGVWEWKDYPEVRARIAQLKAAERARFQPRALDILDIKPSAFASTVSGYSFADPGPTPLVSVIIPVFNNVKLTLECLSSIHQHTPADIAVEIIIADDASTDETQTLLQSVSSIKYIRNEQNLGFLLNCNNALDQVTGTFTVYLNNDVQVTAGWLEALLSTFDDFENVGAVGPKFVYPSGHLQEAGASLAVDGTATMVGLNGDPDEPRYNYTRRVDYVSGACLLTPTDLLKKLGGFSEDFLPCYCEDSDLCMNIRGAGYDIYYNPGSTIIHHLSKTTAAVDESFKMSCIAKNVNVLSRKWASTIEKKVDPRLISFYLPQFHPVPENDLWWGKGFTEWTNVSKARPNFIGHYQPRIPADHGYYDLRLLEVMQAQADLAQRYGVHGFCFYYYWFDGKRLLERPVEQLLLSKKPDIPFCLCWANENWTRRWDGQEHEVLMAQAHTNEDDVAVIYDLIRFFKDDRYIKIDGRPLILIYRATLFPDFAKTAMTWRKVCREQGLGEIYIAMVESFELVQSNTHPSALGCDAAVEFPPQGLAEVKQPTGEIINPEFAGHVADYRDLAVRYATRPAPGYTRFKGVMPGWDNTARRPHTSFCFENATPGAFQAWLEESIADTKEQNFGDERLVFVNAWNEWAEGAYLEPDRRFGHTYLEAVKNATEASLLLKKN